MKKDDLVSISPLDGRYSEICKDIASIFSEYSLIKYRVHIEVKWFIESLASLKASCAIANSKHKLLSTKKAKTIYASAMDIHKNIEKYFDQFPIDIYQTGSGTSTRSF